MIDWVIVEFLLGALIGNILLAIWFWRNTKRPPVKKHEAAKSYGHPYRDPSTPAAEAARFTADQLNTFAKIDVLLVDQEEAAKEGRRWMSRWHETGCSNAFFWRKAKVFQTKADTVAAQIVELDKDNLYIEFDEARKSKT